MNRRAASKSETRQLILNAARELFLEKGGDRCTMRAIAGKAGVSPASVIAHFRNKTALLEVALYEDIENTLARAIASFPEKGDLLEKLMHIPRAMFSFYDTNRQLYRVLIRNTVFEQEADNPHLTRQVEQYLQFIAGLIRQEKESGSVRADVDERIAAGSLFSLYMGVLIGFYRNPEVTPRAAVQRLSAMTQQYLTGIMARERRNGGDS
ncbi:MAG: TetR/AcrR family transcriptional regulator [Deferribacteres bacterium]|nr:TetR/AcrR family transcriptional regulator [Deferribacteres bacterium]